MTTWQLQDAKNRFSAVVDAALAGEHREVTRKVRDFVPAGVRVFNPFEVRRQDDHWRTDTVAGRISARLAGGG